MMTFNTIIDTYENYKSIGGNGGIAIIDNRGYYTPYYYNEDRANDYSKPHPSICPHCGAPTKPHLNNCEYCDVYFD